MRPLKKLLCVALAAVMILMGASCDVLLAPEKSEEVIEKITSGNLPSESTPDEADSTGRNPTETPPSESEKKEEPEEVITEGEMTEEVTTAHTHVEIVLEAVAPTCTEIGLTEGVQCGECGKVLVVQEVIPAAGHTPDADATCTTAQTCTACHIELTPAKGHTAGEWVIDKEPDWRDDGIKHTTCTKCGVTYTEMIKPNSFVVTSENRHKVGYIGAEGEELVIPAVFREGDIWYRVTGIGDAAFHITVLDSVVIPDSVTSIGDSAFSYSLLTTVIFGGSVTYIGDDAFCNCSSLTAIVIPDSVTYIGDCAFLGCIGPTSLVIPNGVEIIGNEAFRGCYGLTEISVEAGNPWYHSDGNCLIETASKTLIVGCENSVIPADGSVTNIGESAFSCSTITNIAIPDNITSIGNSAFFLSGLTSVDIPQKVTEIGDSTFQGCFDLISVVIPNGMRSIGEYAFTGCMSLPSIVIPDSVTSIGAWAFGNCSSLTDIYFTGTESEWNAITKGTDWDSGTPSYTVHYNYIP